MEETSNVMVIFNFSGSRQGPPTSISVARQVLHILSSHYPETLSISHFQQVPWFVKGFINLMWPFVDPATKKKVSFGTVEGGELIREDVVEIEVLLEECGGNLKVGEPSCSLPITINPSNSQQPLHLPTSTFSVRSCWGKY